MSTPTHWDTAYAAGDTTRGWYQPQAVRSVDMLDQLGVETDASIVDVGAGASVLVDDLITLGFTDITCVDHSSVGLAIARERLGAAADSVTWIEADLRTWSPPREYDVWHDRAVLHFLLDDADIERYRATLLAGTHPGSVVIIGVFGPEGPQMCAGLPVRRYDVAMIDRLLGAEFERVSSTTADHVRPDGDTQQYLWTAARRR
jgi:SAM-dependent methyltransferase